MTVCRSRVVLALASAIFLAASFRIAASALAIPQASQQLSAISGTAIDTATRQPIGGVTIFLSSSDRGQFRQQRTDPKGRFVFTDLDPGQYTLRAQRAGYGDGRLGGGVTLRADEWFRWATIGMSRLGALGGRVVDEVGDPIVGAYVRVLRRVLIAGNIQLAEGPIVTTDDEGDYRFSNLAPGEYLVHLPNVHHSLPIEATKNATPRTPEAIPSSPIGNGGSRVQGVAGGIIREGASALVVGSYMIAPVRPGGDNWTYPPRFYPGVRDVADAAVIELRPGEERSGIDWQIQPVRAFRITGRLDASTELIGGFILRLVPRGLDTLGFGSEVATAAVGANGSFSFLRVPAGEYTLLAPGSVFHLALDPTVLTLRPIQLPRTVGFEGLRFSGEGPLAGTPGLRYRFGVPDTLSDAHAGFVRTDLVVTSHDVNDLVVRLQRTGSISGEIVYGDRIGSAPPCALEVASASGSLLLGARKLTIRTEAAGFSVPALLPGEYVLQLTHCRATVVSITANGRDVTREPIPIRENETTALSIRLSGKLIGVTGVVRNDNGELVSGATALLFPVDRNLWKHQGFLPTWIRSAVSSSDGHFDLDELRPGEYYLVAVDAASLVSWNAPAFLERMAVGAERITFQLGDRASRDLSLRTR